MVLGIMQAEGSRLNVNINQVDAVVTQLTSVAPAYIVLDASVPHTRMMLMELYSTHQRPDFLMHFC